MERDAQNVLVSSIRRLIRAEQTQQLTRLANKTHPADLAAIFASLTVGQQLEVLRLIDDWEKRGDVLSELDPSLLAELVAELPDEELSEIFAVMPTDDTNYVLQVLDTDRSTLLLEAMPDDDQSEATSMLAYKTDSAGALMVTEFLALFEEVTAGEAVKIVQKGAEDAEIVFYIYVVNDIGQLVGVTSLRELVQQPPARALKDFMIPDVIRVSADTDQEDVARLVAKYNLLALPVVEGGNILVGVVTVDDIIDVIRHEANEDMLRMAGAGHEQDISLYRNPFESARTRLPWLAPGFLTGVAGVLVIHSFAHVLSLAILLVAFLPMVLALARNVGLQSATIVTRALAMGQLDVGRAGRVVGRELVVGMICGLSYGLLVGGLGGLYFQATEGDPGRAIWFGLTAGLGLLVAMLVSTVGGTIMPLLFDRWKLDPALTTGPFFASAMDVATTAIYLGIAGLILS